MKTKKTIAVLVVVALMLASFIPGMAFAKDETKTAPAAETSQDEQIIDQGQETETTDPSGEAQETTGTNEPQDGQDEGTPAEGTDPEPIVDPVVEPVPEDVHEDGFFKEDGKWYYYENGEKVKGFKEIDGHTYYFRKKTGERVKGFRTIDGQKYYFIKKNGHMAKGFLKLSDNKYYFDEKTGVMAKGLTKVGDHTYHFKKKTGIMSHGFITIGGYKYYFKKSNGRMAKGFMTISKEKYYFSKKNGHMLKGFQKIKGKKYYFGKSSGKMFKGVHKIGKDICTFDKSGALVRTIYGGKKAICLTWDDGPSDNTLTIMNALLDAGGRGTFFVCGNRVDAYSNTLKTNYKAGNQIGNHSWSHPVLSNLSAEGIKNEISSTSNKIKSVTGEAPKICRTPYGINTEFVRNNVNMPIILWSIDTLDWKTRNADSTYNSIMNSARDGAVVLMHDLYSETAAAAVRAIPALVNNGYQLVTVEEMAMLKGVTLKNATVYGNF